MQTRPLLQRGRVFRAVNPSTKHAHATRPFESTRSRRQWNPHQTRAHPKPTRGARVFISYRRNAEPDESVAGRVYEALSPHCDVFIDQLMTVGTIRAEKIESEIRSSDFFIALLSTHSIHSEMVKGEIEKAHEFGKEQKGRPAILPMRLALEEALPYSLGPYLNHINWAVWEGEGDTPQLIENLTRAIRGQALTAAAPEPSVCPPGAPCGISQPFPAAQIEMPEGTMAADSVFYVERPFDSTAMAAIGRQGVTITIKGPRQMGKSSLLIRTISAAAEAGKRIAFLDFQLFDKAALSDGDLFFRQFCSWLTDALEMDDEVERYWSDQLGNSQRCTLYADYFREHLHV